MWFFCCYYYYQNEPTVFFYYFFFFYKTAKLHCRMLFWHIYWKTLTYKQGVFVFFAAMSSVSPACQKCPSSSLVPFTFMSQGSPRNLIHADMHNTLHWAQSRWYWAPLFPFLHLSLLFLRSLFVVPLHAWVIPNWAHNWNGNHPCFSAT